MREYTYTTNVLGGDGKYGYVDRVNGGLVDSNGQSRFRPGW